MSSLWLHRMTSLNGWRVTHSVAKNLSLWLMPFSMNGSWNIVLLSHCIVTGEKSLPLHCIKESACDLLRIVKMYSTTYRPRPTVWGNILWQNALCNAAGSSFWCDRTTGMIIYQPYTVPIFLMPHINTGLILYCIVCGVGRSFQDVHAIARANLKKSVKWLTS